ncbi:hypothetical protein Pr1d_02190 [Bythopirellula goksoeyrii]|uniref:Uncharacterized protein n=1 Tax=Bythopirellula goksoeyrii TaxID=1400387 RepID=A0A5B9Q1V6_9BACT|nr:hypothetical protein Pr1d_02190 [Bythopirellula goksoeyrii]
MLNSTPRFRYLGQKTEDQMCLFINSVLLWFFKVPLSGWLSMLNRLIGVKLELSIKKPGHQGCRNFEEPQLSGRFQALSVTGSQWHGANPKILKLLS